MTDRAIKTPIRIEGITAILSVKDMKATREFYVDLLGFKEEDWGTDEFTSFRHTGGSFYACQGYQGNPGTWIWVGFDGDIFALYEELKVANVSFQLPPTNYSWALEMAIYDPDGHVLRFGKEPDETKPYVDLEG
ncbi:VOC family protein [Emticicia sp. BO119]|uniref:VOC family protein n=1 Tax=Emticicia sp. BO119 TaxID=2757768 RepID=UPI0015F0EA53|nr:VOC family protein [Emticicia sp. BO119]MBA4849832.1 VOC family protein [Emticicia sp. BO119]